MLNQLLADTTDLYSHAKQAHWNVRGQDFFSLHELFDKVSEQTLEHADEIAERVGQLGYSVSGTIREAARSSHLPEYPLDLADGEAHIEQLSKSLAEYTRHVRKGIDQADEAGDAVTNDILIQICRKTDKILWFVESHGARLKAVDSKTQAAVA